MPRQEDIGRLLPDDLYVRRSALDHLKPLLRIYEGCGRAYLGEVEGANIIKIHRRSVKISYLSYPDFETDPHPALQRCVRLSLRTRTLDCYDYDQSANPPILHRKETFLHPTHPVHAKFARLTSQEEAAGLLAQLVDQKGDSPSKPKGTVLFLIPIGTRTAWLARLQAHGLTLRGHRLVRVSSHATDG